MTAIALLSLLAPVAADETVDRGTAWTHTWHTNLDTYGRVVPEDAQASAAAIASAVYHLAMRDEKLPRFAAAEMPAPTPADPPVAAAPTTAPVAPRR